MAIVTKGYSQGMLRPMQFYSQGMLLGENYIPRACCQHSQGLLKTFSRARRKHPFQGSITQASILERWNINPPLAGRSIWGESLFAHAGLCSICAQNGRNQRRSMAVKG